VQHKNLKQERVHAIIFPGEVMLLNHSGSRNPRLISRWRALSLRQLSFLYLHVGYNGCFSGS